MLWKLTWFRTLKCLEDICFSTGGEGEFCNMVCLQLSLICRAVPCCRRVRCLRCLDGYTVTEATPVHKTNKSKKCRDIHVRWYQFRRPPQAATYMYTLPSNKLCNSRQTH